MKGAKDDLPSSQTPGVVYALGCTECERVYIGETGRTAEQRVKEHNAHVKHDRQEQSAVAKHVIKKDHRMHWQPHSITKEADRLKRLIKEAIYIHRVEMGRER